MVAVAVSDEKMVISGWMRVSFGVLMKSGRKAGVASDMG